MYFICKLNDVQADEGSYHVPVCAVKNCLLSSFLVIVHTRGPVFVQHVGTCYTITGYLMYCTFSITLFGL